MSRPRHSWRAQLGYDFCELCGIHRRLKKGSGTGPGEYGRRVEHFYRPNEREDWDRPKPECVNRKQEMLFGGILEERTERRLGVKKRPEILAPSRSRGDGDEGWLWDHGALQEGDGASSSLPLRTPPGTLPPLRIGYVLVHPLQDRRDVDGVPGCDVTLMVLDRRPICYGSASYWKHGADPFDVAMTPNEDDREDDREDFISGLMRKIGRERR